MRVSQHFPEKNGMIREGERQATMAQRILAHRYRVLELIGSGGMAQVHRGFDEVLGRPVAIKTMMPELASNPGFVTQFQQEARSAARLNDPRIVGVYDWGLDQSSCFIVMELVDGFDLRTMLHYQDSLYPQPAARITQQVCKALDAAHGYGIIHSDVKPSNIMFTRTGIVKMADFGIVQIGRTRNGGRGAMGTVRYMSPEQAAGRPLDRKSDIYSLGVTLYEMCGGIGKTSKRNEQAANQGEVNGGRTASWSYVPLSQLDPAFDEEFDRIVETCLQHDPADRYPTMGKLHEALQAYLNHHEEDDPEVLGRQSPEYWALAFVSDRTLDTGSIKVDGPVVLGRRSEADIQIPSRSVSGLHAKIEPKGGFLIIEDLGSSNGTLVNGLPIHGRVYCRPGDVIKIGETRLRIGCKH